jgi:hypothetical protein
MRTRLTVALLSGALTTQAAYSLEAAATVVNVNEWAVARNGATILDDSFNRNMTLDGGAGSFVPSGTTFEDDGTPASYFVQGSIPLTTANNGQAQFNTANGILTPQPPPSPPLALVNASIFTGTDSSGSHTLTPATTFSTIALFDLAVPSVVSGQYQFYLGNNQGPANPGREVRMPIVETSSGPVLRFVWLDLAHNLRTVINEVSLTPTELAEPQLELEFSHDIANSDVIAASYAFGSGDTLASFGGTLTPFGSTDSSTDIFQPKNFAIPGFEALDPIPEPSSLALLATAALCSLGVIRRRMT